MLSFSSIHISYSGNSLTPVNAVVIPSQIDPLPSFHVLLGCKPGNSTAPKQLLELFLQILVNKLSNRITQRYKAAMLNPFYFLFLFLFWRFYFYSNSFNSQWQESKETMKWAVKYNNLWETKTISLRKF